MNRINISLGQDDYRLLQTFIKQGKRTRKELERAYILLALHRHKSYKEIEDYYYVNRTTIWRTGKAYQEGGMENALYDKARSGQPKKYLEKQEAEIVALACSKSPSGTKRWTIRLLTAHLKKQKGFETINRETVRLTLKKTKVSLG